MKFRPGTDEGDYQVKLRSLTDSWKTVMCRVTLAIAVVKWRTKLGMEILPR